MVHPSRLPPPSCPGLAGLIPESLLGFFLSIMSCSGHPPAPGSPSPAKGSGPPEMIRDHRAGPQRSPPLPSLIRPWQVARSVLGSFASVPRLPLPPRSPSLLASC